MELKSQLNFKIALRGAMTIFCLGGLLLQTSYLMNDFMSGRTIVNIRFKRLDIEPIPAFTICYPCFMSMERAVELYPEYKEVFEEHQEFIKKKSVDHSEYNDENKNKSFHLYFKVYNPIATKRPDSLPVLDHFEKLSIPFNWTEKEEKKTAIQIKANGIYTNMEGAPNYIGVTDEDPVESLAAEYQALCIRKCYTFFSALNKKWRDFKLDLDYLTINVEHRNTWFSPNVYDWIQNGIFLSMHSPHVLPNIIKGENFLQLESQRRHLLTYSSITTELLDSKFDTNCINYDLEDHKRHVNMRSDCITLCILEAMKKECHIDCVFQTEALLRKQLFVSKPGLRFCHIFANDSINQCLYKNVLIQKSLCNDKCQSDCHFTYYDWDVKTENFLQVSPWHKQVYINVKHNRLPDQIVKHFPETNFISFFSNFGGLLGMWLGMSILDSYFAFYRYAENYKLNRNKRYKNNKFKMMKRSAYIGAFKKNQF